ncbi:DMT family transporter [bacterium]|jgi:drug/metabolite transporter (DMT)-like permease|nr:DMT family transporter [Flavobacteriaceae bacterium]MDB4206646.1 DMT family transporter [Flavobacteriaceae bacterium]MDC0117798.1 DMT family transporter [bacterium]MDG1394506.1 DMT family transporter [Flavobacteriaceae bacterium]
MPSVKFINQLHLHFLVFIAGFTAILGEFISINAIALVWFRMAIAAVMMFGYIKIKRVDLKIPFKTILKFFVAGIIIALHWITFFAAIKASNISITLAMFSTGAFFAAFIEPLFFRRKIISYEIFFGLVVIFGVVLITQTELRYLTGILLGISSALFSTLFAVLNGKFVEQHSATVISFYEFIGGVAFISLYLLFSDQGFSEDFFILNSTDWICLFILASICTAYAFIASIHVMKHISPFSVVLTYNLEPIYGIVLALVLFPETETMTPMFYVGALLIICTVLLNAVYKKTRN